MLVLHAQHITFILTTLLLDDQNTVRLTFLLVVHWPMNGWTLVALSSRIHCCLPPVEQTKSVGAAPHFYNKNLISEANNAVEM